MTLPIRKDDEVQIIRGSHKGAEGKVVAVSRRKWVIHIDRVTRDKVNGATVHIGVHPSNVVITSIKMDKDRRAMIERRAKGWRAHKASKEAAKESKESAVRRSIFVWLAFANTIVCSDYFPAFLFICCTLCPFIRSSCLEHIHVSMPYSQHATLSNPKERRRGFNRI